MPGDHTVAERDLALSFVVCCFLCRDAVIAVVLVICLGAVCVEDGACVGIILAAHLPYGYLRGIFRIMDRSSDLYTLEVCSINSDIRPGTVIDSGKLL